MPYPYPGQILWYKDFEFDDKSKKDKLFVVLNDTEADSTCLALKTTSQPRRYVGANKGCNEQKNVFFVPCTWERCFKVDTYVQLPQIFQIPTDTLLVGDISRNILVTNSLSMDSFALLKSCLKKYKEDIADNHWKLIFSRKS